MTLADELERLGKLAAAGPWDGAGGTYAYPSGVRDPKMRVAEFGGAHAFQNADLVFALVNNLPVIIDALRADALMRQKFTLLMNRPEIIGASISGLRDFARSALEHDKGEPKP